MMMDDEEALKESVSNLRSAILLHRTDIVRSILSTAADCKETVLFVSHKSKVFPHFFYCSY